MTWKGTRQRRVRGRKPLTIVPEYTIIASPGQRVRGDLLDVLSERQRAVYEKARADGVPVDIQGSILVSFLEIEDGDEMMSLPGTGLVLDKVVKFDAKMKDRKSVVRALEILTTAYLDGRAIRVRTQKGEDAYHVSHLDIDGEDTSVKFTKTSPSGRQIQALARTESGAHG